MNTTYTPTPQPLTSTIVRFPKNKEKPFGRGRYERSLSEPQGHSARVEQGWPGRVLIGM